MKIENCEMGEEKGEYEQHRFIQIVRLLILIKLERDITLVSAQD